MLGQNTIKMHTGRVLYQVQYGDSVPCILYRIFREDPVSGVILKPDGPRAVFAYARTRIDAVKRATILVSICCFMAISIQIFEVVLASFPGFQDLCPNPTDYQ